MRRGTLFVLITAHPDDESLFFLPTIWNLLKMKQSGNSEELHCQVWLVCLTTGDYDGLGSTRSKELEMLCQTIIPFDKFLLVNNPKDLPDHPCQRWNTPAASDCLSTLLTTALDKNQTQWRPQNLVLITFDAGGVSGHRNHQDTFFAVQNLWARQQPPYQQPGAPLPPLQIWSLETVYNPIRKYIPIYEWFLLLVYWCLRGMDVTFRVLSFRSDFSQSWYAFGRGTCEFFSCGSSNFCNKIEDDYFSQTRSIIFRLHDPLLSWKAMSMHASQFVWYRRLFVVFSCYTYVNHLRRMDIESDGNESGDSGRGKL